MKSVFGLARKEEHAAGTKFIILSRYRSGSNLLKKSIERDPTTIILSEILNLVNVAREPQKYLDRNFIKKLFGRPNDTAITAIGFKLMYGQAFRQELDESYWGPNISQPIRNQIQIILSWLAKNNLPIHSFEHILDQIKEDKEIRIVHLVRQNQLDSYVSLQLAMIENNWMGKTYKINSKGIHIDVIDLERYFIQGDTFYHLYHCCFENHKVLEITYRELSLAYNETVLKVSRFLGLRGDVPPAPPVAKQNTYNMRNLIRNYDAVSAYFRNTRWKNFFIY